MELGGGCRIKVLSSVVSVRIGILVFLLVLLFLRKIWNFVHIRLLSTIFIFSPNDSPSKSMRDAALSIFYILQFFLFLPSLDVGWR